MVYIFSTTTKMELKKGQRRDSNTDTWNRRPVVRCSATKSNRYTEREKKYKKSRAYTRR